jgi:hypothetical protein
MANIFWLPAKLGQDGQTPSLALLADLLWLATSSADQLPSHLATGWGFCRLQPRFFRPKERCFWGLYPPAFSMML